MDYQGVIIEESLSNCAIMKKLMIIDTQIEKVTEKSETPWLDKWTMHTVMIKENEMNEYAKKLSQLIDVKHCDNWYCDFKNDQFHYVIFYHKVFKLDRMSKWDYDQMQKYAISIGLPEHQLPKFMEV